MVSCRAADFSAMQNCSAHVCTDQHNAKQYQAQLIIFSLNEIQLVLLSCSSCSMEMQMWRNRISMKKYRAGQPEAGEWYHCEHCAPSFPYSDQRCVRLWEPRMSAVISRIAMRRQQRVRTDEVLQKQREDCLRATQPRNSGTRKVSNEPGDVTQLNTCPAWARVRVDAVNRVKQWNLKSRQEEKPLGRLRQYVRNLNEFVRNPYRSDGKLCRSKTCWSCGSIVLSIVDN